MRTWYDGYLFGKSEVYNPWSALNQAKTWARDMDAFAVPWWANTSSNNIIKTLVGQSDDETKAAVELLIHGGSVETTLKETVTYGDLTDCNENIWSFLFFTGYLKIQDVIPTNEETGDAAANRALRQINDCDYAAEARSQGYRNIIKYGVAFKDKVCYAVVG